MSLDSRLLCPNFIKGDAEEATHEMGIPEVVQATFYAMTIAYAGELGVLLR